MEVLGWDLVFTRDHPTSSVHHVIPAGDTLEHTASTECACQPVPERVVGLGNVTRTFCWKHNAYDRRE